MKYLIDTHAFLWWLDGDEQLPLRVRALLGDATHTGYVSAASAWEITTKFRIGKLAGAREVATNVAHCIASQSFSFLSITIDHAQRGGLLPGSHRDPFDRILIAQCEAENLAIVSNDEIFDVYKVNRIWEQRM